MDFNYFSYIAFFWQIPLDLKIYSPSLSLSLFVITVNSVAPVTVVFTQSKESLQSSLWYRIWTDSLNAQLLRLLLHGSRFPCHALFGDPPGVVLWSDECHLCLRGQEGE